MNIDIRVPDDFTNFQDDKDDKLNSETIYSKQNDNNVMPQSQKRYKGQSITCNAMCHVSEFWREHLERVLLLYTMTPCHVAHQHNRATLN